MMLASRMMCALRHIGQTSHHCETKWSNIIFAKQMHHIAVGDASLKCPEFYDIITFKGGDFVKENKLAELSMEFAVDIINLVRQLKENREAIISNQIGRSGTSIGANIHEAQYAQGKKDFTCLYLTESFHPYRHRKLKKVGEWIKNTRRN